MDIDDLKDSTKDWLNSRLKNPYFAAVIAVWIVTNRVVVYSIFNFDEGTTLSERLKFIHSELIKFNRFEDWFCIHWNWLKGFWGTIVWSFIWGLITMAFLDIVNSIGKMFFKLASKLSTRIVRLVKDDSWVSKEEYDKLLIFKDTLEEDIGKRRAEISRVLNESDQRQSDLAQAIVNLDEKETELTKAKTNQEALKAELSKLNRQHDDLIRQNEKFRIDYASYGTEKYSMEVTSIVRELISQSPEFIANNTTFKHDPFPYAPKEFIIKYTYKNAQQTFKTFEGAKVLFFNDNSFSSSETDETVFASRIANNLKSFCNNKHGAWVKKVFRENNESILLRQDIVEITRTGQLIIGRASFDLFVQNYGEAAAFISLVDDSRKIVSGEELKFVGAEMIGKNNLNQRVAYSRQ